MPAPLRLHRFRFRDPSTGRWMRARYRATLVDIRQRYVEWRIEDEGELREGVGAQFSALGAGADAQGARASRLAEPHVETAPCLAPEEAALARCFLRRYVTYCARRGRYAAMNGAARLLRELAAYA
jgi:hypothetical protein